MYLLVLMISDLLETNTKSKITERQSRMIELRVLLFTRGVGS